MINKALQLPLDWQDAIEPRHKPLSPACLRLFIQNDFLAIVHAAPAKLSFFVEKQLPRLFIFVRFDYVRDCRRNFWRADDDTEFGIDVCRPGIEIE